MQLRSRLRKASAWASLVLSLSFATNGVAEAVVDGAAVVAVTV